MKNKFLKSNARFVTPIVIAVFVIGGVVVPMVRADQYDEQIKQIQNDSNNKQAMVAQLQAQANSYQDAISKLQQQIDAIRGQIAANEKLRDNLQSQIVAAEAELAKQKKLLGENIKTMYVEGEISTLEMLASSKDLSEFLDKQQYRTAVQDKIKVTLDKINALKVQLKDQKSKIDQLLAEQQNMNNQLSSGQAEQNRLLSLTEGEKNAYNTQLKENSAQIASLRAQQYAANRRLGGKAVAGDPNKGGYPSYLANANYYAEIVDPWGMFARQCVSYTAWKVYQAYGHMPYWGGHGNANQWPASARADGIPTGTTPKVGSVAVSMAGYYGHVMWVEAVSGNQIYVSQYNYSAPGEYSEMWVNSAGLTYIYFN